MLGNSPPRWRTSGLDAGAQFQENYMNLVLLLRRFLLQQLALLSHKMLDAKVPQREIGLVYDKLPGIYDVWGMLTESRARAQALELAAVEDCQDVLEVAVGTGLAFYEIVKLNPNGPNIGIDLSNGMLDMAKNRMKKLSLENYCLTIGTAFYIPVQT